MSSPHPSAELIQHTIQVWEPRLGRKLTEEDARQILENTVGLFKVLAKWDRERAPQKDEEDIVLHREDDDTHLDRKTK